MSFFEQTQRSREVADSSLFFGHADQIKLLRRDHDLKAVLIRLRAFDEDAPVGKLIVPAAFTLFPHVTHEEARDLLSVHTDPECAFLFTDKANGQCFEGVRIVACLQP